MPYLKTPYREFLTLLLITAPLIVLLSVNFLYFHILVEAYTVAIGVTIFVISINARQYFTNSFFSILGIAFLSVAAVDFIHSLAYKGMNIGGLSSANTATQLWILGRYLHSLSIVGVFVLMNRPVSLFKVSLLYAVLTFAGLGLILSGHFPDCYIEGVGLTPFKIISELVVIALFASAFVLSKKLRAILDDYSIRMIQMGIIAAAAAEVMFSLYVDVYSIVNASGHIFKMASFYFFYRACVYMSLNKPFESIFAKLNEQRQFLSTVIESLSHPFYVIDAETYKIKIANAATGLMGSAVHTCHEVRHSSEAPCSTIDHTCPVKEVKVAKRPVVVEHQYTDNEGRHRIEEVHAYPIFDDSKEVRQVIEYCFDITERIMEREQLKKLSLAIEQSSNSILITDSEGVIEYVNSTFCKVTGYAPQEVIGRKPSLFKSGVTPPEVYRDLWNTIKAGRLWKGELCNKKKGGELFWEMLTITPLKDDSGAITHFVAIREDIQDKIRANVAEEKARDAERRLFELEREMQTMDHLMRLHQPTLAARAYGQIPLKESTPEVFGSFVKDYGDLMERYLEVQIYKVDFSVSESLKEFSDRLGMSKLGPRDLIDIHTAALKEKIGNLKKEGSRAYHEEGKIMLLELMGYLVNYYRNYFIITTRRNK